MSQKNVSTTPSAPAVDREAHGSTFLRDEFESLLVCYLPLKKGIHSLNKTQGWTPGQIQIVRDWISESGYGFTPTYDRLEAADLNGRPFTGQFAARNADFAQEVLMTLVTLRDRSNSVLNQPASHNSSP